VLIDSATFLVGAAAIAMLTLREAQPHRVADRWRRQILGGVRYLRQVGELRQLVVACAIGWSVLGLAETVVFAVVAGLHRPPAFVGVLVCVQGAGAIVGAVSAPPMMRRHGEGRLAAIALVAGGAAWAAQVGAVLWPTVLALFAAGMTLSWLSVGANTLIQRRTPNELLGRVDSVASISVSAPQTVFIAVGAALVGAVDYRWLLGAMATAMTISGGWLLSRPDQQVAPGPTVASRSASQEPDDAEDAEDHCDAEADQDEPHHDGRGSSATAGEVAQPGSERGEVLQFTVGGIGVGRASPGEVRLLAVWLVRFLVPPAVGVHATRMPHQSVLRCDLNRSSSARSPLATSVVGTRA
jgi:MFS family permease